MSVKVMGRVWDDSGIKGSAKLLLLAIADFADDNGKAWPSVETLARKIGMGERNTRYMLRALEEQGRLSIDLSAGPKGSSMYRVLAPNGGQSLPPANHVADTEGGQNTTQRGGKTRHKSRNPIAPDPSYDPLYDPPQGQPRAAALPPAPTDAPTPVVVVAELPTATAPEPATVTVALDGEPLPAAPEIASTPKSLAQQPAVVVYRDTFLAYPSRAQMTQIVQHGVVDLEHWAAVTAAWCRSGYNPRNIGGMLDWYDNPERMVASRPQAKAQGNAPRSKVAASMDAVDQVMAMLERQGVTP